MVKLVLICAILTFGAGAAAGEDVHWTYSGATGPEAWATLCPEFSACAGHNQSPVNLTGVVDAELEPLKMAYVPGGQEIINNGHTVQVNYAPGSRLTIDGIDFALKQFHFHSPSENVIEGRHFAMEIHLVHADADGNLAVVAVMVEEGGENAALARLWSSMPPEAGGKNALSTPFAVTDLLPKASEYYRFNGSLTTPPCTEGVRWFVLQAPVNASPGQVASFTGVMKHPNNRPVQTTNARLILK